MKLLHLLVTLVASPPLLAELVVTLANGPIYLSKWTSTRFFPLSHQPTNQAGYSQWLDQGGIPLLLLADQESQEQTTAIETTIKQQHIIPAWEHPLSTRFADLLTTADKYLSSEYNGTALAARAHRGKRRKMRSSAGKVHPKTGSWRSRYGGQARISLGADPSNMLSKGESQQPGPTNTFQWHMDFSQPIYETATSTWLLEIGGYTKNGDYLTDGGVVYRYGLPDGQTLGINTFVDLDFNRAQARSSVGIEWMTTNTGLRSNIYAPLSDWQTEDPSVPFDFMRMDYSVPQTRPAYGIDISLECALLSGTPLSASASYSYWLGEGVGVGVTNSHSETSTPSHSATVGIYWQPVPLFKLSASHTFLSGNRIDNRVIAELQFDLRGGWRDLFRPTLPQASTGNSWRYIRHRFVNRNNDMIIQTTEQPVITKPGFDITVFGKPDANLEEDVFGRLLTAYNTIQFFNFTVKDSTNNLYLPSGKQFHGKTVTISHLSKDASANVHYNGDTYRVQKHNADITLKNVRGKWLLGAVTEGKWLLGAVTEGK